MTKAQLQSEIARLQAELTESRRLLALAIEALQRASAPTVPLPIQPAISWLPPSNPGMHPPFEWTATPVRSVSVPFVQVGDRPLPDGVVTASLGAGTTTVMCR